MADKLRNKIFQRLRTIITEQYYSEQYKVWDRAVNWINSN